MLLLLLLLLGSPKCAAARACVSCMLMDRGSCLLMPGLAVPGPMCCAQYSALFCSLPCSLRVGDSQREGKLTKGTASSMIVNPM